MKHITSVNLGNFLLSLSDAMDLASTQLSQHQQRVAFASFEMGRRAALPDEHIETMFIAALLHDVGALSLEEKLSLHTIEEKKSDYHCLLGEALLEEVPLFKDGASIVRNHHRRWSEWDQSIDTPLVVSAQIIYLADYLERLIDRRQYILHQNQHIIDQICAASGTFFHPRIVDIFTATACREEFWLDLTSPRLYSLLLHNGPQRKLELDLPNISSLTRLFKHIIDFRSPFTATHSSGVAACAKLLSKMFGFTDTEVQLMEVAGDLHDLGKLAIPNSILDKPAGLTKDEFQIIKSHTYFTYSVLSSIRGFEHIAGWSAYHHEKLDGSGYPFHCTDEELDTGARILMVADLFTALTENRPYRNGMSRKQCLEVINDFAVRGLMDSRVIKILMENYGEIHSCVADKQMQAFEFYKKCRSLQ